jgi:hypothetical protein
LEVVKIDPFLSKLEITYRLMLKDYFSVYVSRGRTLFWWISMDLVSYFGWSRNSRELWS